MIASASMSVGNWNGWGRISDSLQTCSALITIPPKSNIAHKWYAAKHKHRCFPSLSHWMTKHPAGGQYRGCFPWTLRTQSQIRLKILVYKTVTTCENWWQHMHFLRCFTSSTYYITIYMYSTHLYSVQLYQTWVEECATPKRGLMSIIHRYKSGDSGHTGCKRGMRMTQQGVRQMTFSFSFLDIYVPLGEESPQKV